jgi:hypothetical protein
MRQSFIDSDLLYRGVLSGRFDYTLSYLIPHWKLFSTNIAYSKTAGKNENLLINSNKKLKL